MKFKLLALTLLAAGSMFAGTRVYVGFGYPAAPVVAYARPVCPGPGYVWVNGFYEPVGPRYVWRAGYWALPPRPHAVWVAPYYRNRFYFRGYWR